MRTSLVLVLVLAADAHAQSPAEPAAPAAPEVAPAEAAPPAPAPAPTPPPAPPPAMPYATGTQAPGVMLAPPPRSVMDRRWAIGVDVGPETLQADVDGADKVEFGQLELAARYRIRRAIELGLAIHMGGSSDIGMGGIYLDFRYRFRAEQPLNVYALASLGALAVAHENGSDDEKRGRGSLRLGGGLEYRWSWFALVVELRLVGVGENKDLAVMPMETVGYQLARSKLSGGSFAMGANFYF